MLCTLLLHEKNKVKILHFFLINFFVIKIIWDFFTHICSKLNSAFNGVFRIFL